MNLFTGESADEFFGGTVTPAVRRLLDQIRNASAPQIESLLWTAQACSPESLPVYYLLYKFHATRRQLDLAERAARSGLVQAARQAALPEDWRNVEPGMADFSQLGPARFWLFTLKALAFILLRQGHLDDARTVLAKIRSLHINSGLGDDVIAALLAGSSEG